MFRKLKKIRIESTYAFYSNTSIGKPKITIVEAGEGHEKEGFIIEPRHRYIQIWSYDLDKKFPMKATVALRPNFFQSLNNITNGRKWSQTISRVVVEATIFPLSSVIDIQFYNGDEAYHVFSSAT